MYPKSRFLTRIASVYEPYGPFQSRVDALESDRRGEGGSVENL
jgi:hypothetical protein